MAQSVEPGPNLWAFVQQWWSLEPRFVGKVFDPTPFGIACHFCSKHRCGLLLFNLSCFGRIARVVSLVIGDGSSKSRLYFQSAQTELSCLERVTCQLGNYLSTARSLMAMHSGRIIDRPRAAIDICYNSSVAQSFCIQGHVLLDRIFAFALQGSFLDRHVVKTITCRELTLKQFQKCCAVQFDTICEERTHDDLCW